MMEDFKSDNKWKVSFAIKRIEKKALEWRGDEELGRRMRTNVKLKNMPSVFLFMVNPPNVGRDGFIDNYGIRHKLIIPKRRHSTQAMDSELLSALIRPYLGKGGYELCNRPPALFDLICCTTTNTGDALCARWWIIFASIAMAKRYNI